MLQVGSQECFLFPISKQSLESSKQIKSDIKH